MDQNRWNAFATYTVTLFNVICAVAAYETRPRRRTRTHHVAPYLRQRYVRGRFAKDFDDMLRSPRVFRENFHMNVETFNVLYEMVRNHLEPKRYTRTDAIVPKQKLAAVLEYLASGDLQRHVASCYRISKQEFGVMIDQVCDSVIFALHEIVGEQTANSFLEVANGFNETWQFPNCIGAIDGKHVAIKAPAKSGSIFYNYKGFHSIVLMAVSDHKYNFIHFDVGAYGSEGDANVFSTSKFGQDILNDRLNFPPDATINGEKLPFYFVGDDAFPICKRILKPFKPRPSSHLTSEETIFNYRLSRARRCVENAFGILCSKWQCLKRTMFCSPDRAQKIVMACCYLHNFIIKRDMASYCPQSFADKIGDNGSLIEGEWRRRIENSHDSLYFSSFHSYRGRSITHGKYIREKIKTFVNSEEGSVPWQQEYAFQE